MGNSLLPENWGWKKIDGTLVPVTTILPPAPDELLHMISCGCKSECGARCCCRTAGLDCSMMCLHCRGRSCSNDTPVNEVEVDDDQDEI